MAPFIEHRRLPSGDVSSIRQAASNPSRARAGGWPLAVGVVLIAINLRPAAASIGPLLDRIEAATGLSSGWAGALATLPVLCFGLLAPIAPPLARRRGLRQALTLAMAGLLAGLLLRLVHGTVALFAGTALAGAGIATGNVLLPVLIRRDFPRQTGSAMALYTTSLIAFAALAAGVTVPLTDALGGGWRTGLGIWVLPAAVALLAWAPALRRRDLPPGPAAPADPTRPADPAAPADPTRPAAPDAEAPGHSARALLGHPLAWMVTLFFALQSGGFYATLAWLPSIFRSHGTSESDAGFLLSLSMVVGLATALTVPGLAGRMRSQRALVVVCCGLTAAGLTGILLAPMAAPYLWTILLGLGQNASFPLALMIIVLRGGSVATTQGLSTLAQSVGYVLAALAPLAVGALHGATHTWTPALILLLALLVPMLLTGLAAGRDRTIAPPDGPETAAAALRLTGRPVQAAAEETGARTSTV
jgi:CP family cyanate transporter-like MFS transporter